VVTRSTASALDAWRERTREAWVEQVEAGIRDSVEGYRRQMRKVHEVREVPALDIAFRHRTKDGYERVVMRFLFFRTHVVTAAAAAPEARWSQARGAAQAVISGFGPPPSYAP